MRERSFPGETLPCRGIWSTAGTGCDKRLWIRKGRHVLTVKRLGRGKALEGKVKEDGIGLSGRSAWARPDAKPTIFHQGG